MLVSLSISVVGGMFTLIVYVIRLSARWGRNEERMTELVTDMKQLTETTDKRLRWLEERTWKNGR